MKKSLFAIAAVTAFAGAAQAQSSVTVYGILDVGFQSATSKTSGVANAVGGAAGNNNAINTVNTSNTTGTTFGQSAETTSRIGFRGTEDIGGGTSAFFTLETTLAPASAIVSTWNNRQTFLGLAQKGMGRASIGTQYTPIHEAIGATSAGQQNNMPGDVVYGANLANATNNAGTRLPGQQEFTYTNNNGGAASGPNNYTNRVSNSIRFASDNFAGFVGKFIYAQNSQDTNAISPVPVAGAQVNTGGYNNYTGYGLGVDYSGVKKLIASANYQTFKANQFAITTAAAGATTGVSQVTTAAVVSPTSGQGTQANSIDTQMYLGATYDFGILKAYAQYINRKASATFDTNVYAKRTAQQIGVRSFVTPKIEPWASMGTGKITNAYYVAPTANGGIATQSAAANVFGWQLGSNYWLSKRTNLYAIYGMTSTGNTVYPQTANGNSANLNSVSNSYSSYAVGMRHTF